MNKKRICRYAATCLILAFAIITQTGCGDKEPVSGTDEYLDTQCTITIYDKDGDEAEEIIAGAFGEIAACEQLLSRTIDGSDVSRINEGAGETVKVDDITAKAIEAGIEMGKLSDGDFDISIGRVTDLWDFKSSNPQLPDPADIQAAVETVDYRGVSITGNKVSLENPEAWIELGGIAKGFIADRVTDYLEEQGVKSAIVNLGGNVVALGDKDGEGFVIGIERPYSDRTEIMGSVTASDMTLVTSGVYERMFKKDGIIYHHILDPETGYPADTDLEAVTITADKGYSGFCDGLSTACLMAGTEGAMKLVKKIQEMYPERHIEAAFTDKKDKVTKTDGMKINPVE